MQRGLPLVVSIELVDFSSSESEIGTSVSSAMLVGLHVVHFWTPSSHSGLRCLLSSSWMSSWFRRLAILFLYAMQ